MPIKRGSVFCAACGERLTSGLTAGMAKAAPSTASITEELDPVDPKLCPGSTERFPSATLSANSQASIICPRCGSTLVATARFCYTCGRPTEPSVIAKTFDATRTATSKGANLIKQAFSSAADRLKQSAASPVPLIAFGLAVVFVILAVGTYLFAPSELTGYTTSELNLATELRSIWWLLLALISVLTGILFKR